MWLFCLRVFWNVSPNEGLAYCLVVNPNAEILKLLLGLIVIKISLQFRFKNQKNMFLGCQDKPDMNSKTHLSLKERQLIDLLAT